MANYGYWKKFDPKDKDKILSCSGQKPDDTWQLRSEFFKTEAFRAWQKRYASKLEKLEAEAEEKEEANQKAAEQKQLAKAA